jgi:lipopolysaccharide/colanic/teichoic acid biosynthesis glycosyltransferase
MKREMQMRVKRIADVALACSGLVMCTPLLALAGVAIKLDSNGPVFFRLRAAGVNGKSFEQWKLRTMVDGARETGDYFETSSTDPRITRVGRFLRRWSIDELPQLWNVIRGEMSLVGPRPAFYELAEQYSAEQARRLAMRPGLTGLAQVSGRNSLSWAERMELDVLYIENYSLRKDCGIMARTIPALFRFEGVYGKDGRVRIPDVG